MALKARLSNTGSQILAPGGRSVSYKGVGTGGSMVVLFIVVFYLTGSGFGWPSEAPLQEGETLPRTGRNQQGKDRKVAALIPQKQLDESKCTNVELLFHRVSLDHGRKGSSAWTETALPEIRDDVNVVVAPMYNPSLFNSTADNSPPHARIHWKKLAR
ncbi:unnamed protein product [Leuciscus chuanchicus]